MRILKVYGAYTLTFRRSDGEWVNKRLSSSTHSRELAERILTAIETVPIIERTRERTDAVAEDLLNEVHYGPAVAS